MRSFTAEWFSIAAVFLLLFAMEGLPSFEARRIAKAVVLAFAAAVSVMKMIRAIKLRIAFKNGLIVTCGGKITLRFGHRWRNLDSCEHAWARYNVNGKEIVGVMVCAVDQKLSEGDNVSVMVNKRSPRVFAFSERQSKDAVLTYVTFSAVTALLLAAEAVMFFTFAA